MEQKFKKNDKVYFINNWYIDYGIIKKVIPYKINKKILSYNYELYFYTDEPSERVYKNFALDMLPQSVLFATKKQLIKSLSDMAKDCEESINKQFKGK